MGPNLAKTPLTGKAIFENLYLLNHKKYKFEILCQDTLNFCLYSEKKNYKIG